MTLNILIEAQTKNETLAQSILARGIKLNKGVRRLQAQKWGTAAYAFLTATRQEMVQKDPTAFMEQWEKADYLKKMQKKEDDQWDNSPCPPEEMAALEGVGDAEEIMARALALAGGDAEKLADVLEEKDKANNKWRQARAKKAAAMVEAE